MSGLPLAIKAAAAAVLVVSIWRALYGPPPERRDIAVARLWAMTSAVLHAGAIYALLDERSGAWLLLIAGVVALCMAFWHARGDDGGGEGGDDPGDDTGPIDWDRFDRARREWDRPRVPA
jgi:hypothetical protein